MHFSSRHAAAYPTYLYFLDIFIKSVKSQIIFQTYEKGKHVLAYTTHVYNSASDNIECKRNA
jgi:hypothetical protein